MKMPDISASQLTSILDEWIIGRNAERDREVLKRRLIDGIKFETLAEEFFLSVRRTKTIVYDGQARIINHLP